MERLIALFRRRPWLCGSAAFAILGTGFLILVLGVALLFPNLVLHFAAFVLRTTTGQELTFGTARWHSYPSLAIHDVALSGPGDQDDAIPYFTAQRIELRWRWNYLLGYGRLGLLEFDEPQLTVGRMLTALAAGHRKAKTPPAEAAEEESDPFGVVRRHFYIIRVVHGLLWIDDLAPGMPAVPLSLGADAPLEWNTGSIKEAESQAEEKTQIATANGIRLYARQDQFSPVLDLGKILIEFTWSGLARKEIKLLSISDPMVYVGPRLFAFADDFKAHMAKPTAAAPPSTTASVPPTPQEQAAPAGSPAKREWVLQDFNLTHLRITVTAFGEPGLALPFSFNSTAQNLSVGQLNNLQFTNRIVISQSDFNFPAYGVKLRGLDKESRVEFNLPPDDGNARNLVETIKMKEASWKEISAQDVWGTVTFDRSGIYGDVGGKFYGGYVKGGYNIGFGDGFPWKSWLNMYGTEVRDPIAKLAGEHFGLEGKADAKVRVEAKARDISKCEVGITFASGGQMHVPSVGDVAQKLPESWGKDSAQRQIVQRLLESFEDYPFDHGSVSLRYGIPTSVAELHLEGPAGKRNFVLNWKQENDAQGIVLPKEKPPEISVQIDKPQVEKPGQPAKTPAPIPTPKTTPPQPQPNPAP